MQQAGLLLINRKRIASLVGGANPPTDTGIIQTPLGVKPDPPVGGVQPAWPNPGVASRVMVIPLAPTGKWASITHDEPHLGRGVAFGEPNLDHVYVVFMNGGQTVTDLNVLFWDPDTKIGPVSAQTYQVAVPP